MNDRVVDRAAVHATPTDLAVRDWLLVGLSFTTGIYEAICFLTFGKVFTAAMTGNLVLLGIGVAGTRQPAGPNAVTVVIALAAFAAGAALAMPILKAFNGDKETEDKNIFQAWPRRVSIALTIALIPPDSLAGTSPSCADRRIFTSVHSTDSLHEGAQIIRSCARLGPIGFRSRQCRMTICSSSAAGCPFIHSRPAKVRISWFTHTHCSPACKAAGTKTLRTTAPLETAFDTALPRSRHSPPCPAPRGARCG